MNIKAIAKLRDNAGLTQAQLADKLDLKPLAVARWETGTREPRLSDLASIADALGVTEQYLAKKIFEKPAE